jgi:threonine/homoserine/homoserine lactone efflux protein
LLALGTIVNLAFSSADLICVWLAEKVSQFINTSPGANRLANRIGGGVLIGLGLGLGLDR